MKGDLLDRARCGPLTAGPSSAPFLCWRVLGNWAARVPRRSQPAPKWGRRRSSRKVRGRVAADPSPAVTAVVRGWLTTRGPVQQHVPDSSYPIRQQRRPTAHGPPDQGRGSLVG